MFLENIHHSIICLRGYNIVTTVVRVALFVANQTEAFWNTNSILKRKHLSDMQND